MPITELCRRFWSLVCKNEGSPDHFESIGKLICWFLSVAVFVTHLSVYMTLD